MENQLDRISAVRSLAELLPLLDEIAREARDGQSTVAQRCALLRTLVLSPGLSQSLETGAAIDALVERLGPPDWIEHFGAVVDKEFPGLVVRVIDEQLDVGHLDLLNLVPAANVDVLLATLKKLGQYIDSVEGSVRRLRGMRVAMVCGALFERLQDGKIWRRRKVPACGIDGESIIGLKQKKALSDLPVAYERRVNQLQRADLRRSLEGVRTSAEPQSLPVDDYDKLFEVRSPLRLGISSANASDNHIRSKEQGGKTLNVGIDLCTADLEEPAPPLRVTARRLAEPRLVLHSRSAEFEADFEINTKGDAAAQSELFFAYNRGGDEALRMVKQALVHTGIVGADSQDVVADVGRFFGDAGVEITTASAIQQGSGLGTSSILAAAILKVLYRLTGHPAGTKEGEYPDLFDQSVLLEQSIGLNSGWQDARGAHGGPSAVKDFYAPPTNGLPTPELSYVEVDAELFRRRVILFDTGIARGATRGLNVVMEAYLARHRHRYGAIRESLAIHDRMVDALRAGDYSQLGQMASRYWQLRCILDPEATNPAIQQLFEPPLSELTEGGTLTGAGGGGFGLLIAREGEEEGLRECLKKLKDQRAYARSAVVDYRLDATGLQLTEHPAS